MGMSEALSMLLATVEQLEGLEVGSAGEVAREADLSAPLYLNGCKYQKVKLVKRLKSYSRPLLLSLEGEEQTSHYLLKRQDVRCEWAAMGCLNIINRCWQHYGHLGFATQVYDIIPIGDTAGLIGVVPDCKTLDRLKREADIQGQGREYRVADFLNRDPAALECLATSTAAYLASNYFLGVGDGHGDNVMVKRSGHLFRVDFGYVFGRGPSLPVVAISFDSPIVWLPEAVVVALLDAGHWDRVLEASKLLLRDLVDAPGEFWCRILAACHCMDTLWQLGSAAYVLSISVEDFQAAVEGMRRSIMKQLKTMLHYRVGYSSRPATVSPRADSELLEQGLVNLLYQIFDFESCVSVELVAEMVHNNSEAVQLKALSVLVEMGVEGAAHADKVMQLISDDAGFSAPIKRAAAQALGQMSEDGSAQAAKAAKAAKLARLLQDTDSTVRKSAVHALGQLNGCGAAHASAIAELLSDPDSSVRAAAVVSLARTGEMGFAMASVIASSFADSDPIVRVAGLHACAIAEKGSAAHLRDIKQLTTDRHAVVRGAAAHALSKMTAGQSEAIAPLLADESPTVRGAAALILSTTDDSITYCQEIIKLLKDADDMVRCAAALALKRMAWAAIDHERDIAFLLMDQSPAVRSTALHALAELKDMPVDHSTTWLLLQERWHDTTLRSSLRQAAGMTEHAIIDDVHVERPFFHRDGSRNSANIEASVADLPADSISGPGLVEMWTRERDIVDL